MTDQACRAACAAAYSQFPALKGVRPVVQRSGPHQVFVFRRAVAGGPGEPAVRLVVRVTVDDVGTVRKVAVAR